MRVHTYCINKLSLQRMRGSVFLEAAIVLPILLALSALAFDFGSWLYTRSALADATAVAARKAATVIADYLDSGPPIKKRTAVHTWCPTTHEPWKCVFNCKAVAAWGQAISENTLKARFGSIADVTVSTSIRYEDGNAQPIVTVRTQRPYRCLVCAGYLSGVLVTQAEALVEDLQMERCNPVPAVAGCDPQDAVRCR